MPQVGSGGLNTGPPSVGDCCGLNAQSRVAPYQQPGGGQGSGRSRLRREDEGESGEEAGAAPDVPGHSPGNIDGSPETGGEPLQAPAS